MSDTEPQPCGPFASATHCCEYHGIHSDDELTARIAQLEVQLEAARDAATVAVHRGAELEGEVAARDAQVLEDGRAIIDQRIKLDSARQILERLRGYAVPVELSRRIDHWLSSATTSQQERLLNHLVTTLVMAAVQWSAHEGRVAAVDTDAATAPPYPFDQPLRTPLLEALLDAAHQLRAAGEL